MGWVWEHILGIWAYSSPNTGAWKTISFEWDLEQEMAQKQVQAMGQAVGLWLHKPLVPLTSKGHMGENTQ